MLQAGLLAKAAVERGLKINPNVKTSLAPGSQVVAGYLDSTGLQQYLDKLGFNCIGFGCTTCIGNSEPLDPDIEQQISEGNLNVGAVLSGNRNFEGRIHPSVQLNWLMSPPLVIAFALVGHTRINFDNEPLGIDEKGQPTFLRDIWPNDYLVKETMRAITKESYTLSYQDMLIGDHAWEDLPISNTDCYPWNSHSTYIIQPPFLELLAQTGHEGLNSCNQVHSPIKIKSANILAIFGDSITTDHISPAGQISPYSPAGKYLIAKGVTPEQFNSYGARRGNHEVMVRGTFANNRLQNEIITPKQGGITRIFDDKYLQNKAHVSIFEASEYYAKTNIPLVIFAGKEYETGSSRDWAAKGCQLLGVKAVIAESFERIHRSNLVGMGIMPLQLPKGTSVESLHLQGNELVDVIFDNNNSSHRLAPNQTLLVTIHSTANDETKGAVTLPVVLRINSSPELDYFIAGGVLPYVANQYL